MLQICHHGERSGGADASSCGSLLVTTDDMYTTHLHGIAQAVADEDLGPETVANWDLLGDKTCFTAGRYDREIRTSLTYRDVLKVSKFALRNSLFKR